MSRVRWSLMVLLLAGLLVSCGDDDGNKPSGSTDPTACFAVTPESGAVEMTFQMDASCSADGHDPLDSLQVRWDWENDGTWDAGYSRAKTADHQYTTAGTKTIKLEVKDTGGLTGATTRTVTVTEPVDEETFAQRIERTNDLAFKLYHELAGTEGNLLISPHSIAVCGAMAYAGARGTTEQQMAAALCLQYPQAGVHAAMQALNDTLMSRGAGQPPDAFRLSIVNGCWGAAYWPYQTDYLGVLTAHYGAGMQMLDFGGHPEESLEAINQWVADQTAGRVQNLLPAGTIDDNTYLVLANTVWFKASWLHQFEPSYTRNWEFTLLDGTSVSVPTMPGQGSYPYYETEGFRTVELPYVGDEVSMYVILPDTGQFAAFEADFDASRLDEIVDALVSQKIMLCLPRFSFTSGFDLVTTLKSLGMTDAFDLGANFTGMDGVDDGVPWIRTVAHKTFIAVDEYGTEAAAATGMELGAGEHPMFYAQRPFLFVIRDKPSGTILFLGRVLDPRG